MDYSEAISKTQERIGVLDAKIKALHSRQDKTELEIKELMKNVLAEMKSIHEFINQEKGKSQVIRIIIGFCLTVLGGLIGKFLLK